MLGLLLLIIWLIPLVAFLLKNALCSKLVKHIQKGNRLYQICAAICVIGIVAWGGVKPNMSMESDSTAQNINGTNINTLNSTIGASSSTSFTDAELASRLVFLDGGTNSSFAAISPENAVVNQKWIMTGAAEDFVLVSPTNWAFPVNDKVYSNIFVSTTGNISFEKPITRTNAFTNQYTVLSPFRSVQSVLPYHLWSEIGNNAQSRFWYAQTEYNSLLLTWENFLYGRDIDYPISYQAELYSNGEFDFRYDLSSLQSNPTNAFAGYQSGNVANKYASLTPYTKSINAKRLNASVANNQDSDLDSILDSDEVFIYGTDPTLADSDFDGMNDGAEIVAGNNPLNPDEDGDGNRDYLTPELSNPEGIVVSTLRESAAIFVFDTILPEDAYATLVINSTIIPLTSQSQVYLYLESGRLYNYELHVPRNVIPNFSFIDSFRLDSGTFSLLNTSIDTNDASNEEEKIMSEERKLIYTLDDTTPIYRGKIANAYIEFVHLPDSTLFPPQSPCIHGEEEISVRLRTVPSEFLAKGEIVDIDNLVHEGNNIYTMAVNGIGQNNSTYGSITYRCPESGERVTVYMNAHICESITGRYCFGCGVYHQGVECRAHTGLCQIPFVQETNCTCEIELVEIMLGDINANGIEDRNEYLQSNIKSIMLIDNIERCCCVSNSRSEFRNVKCGYGLENKGSTPFADSINLVGQNPSGEQGYTTISYDVYDANGEKVNSITKKALVLGLDLMFDYNDDGVINSEDKQLQYYHSISNYYVSASSEIFPIRIKAEIPPNLTAGCSSPNLNLFNDADGEIPYEQSTVLTNGIYNLYYQSSLTNANTSINLGCNNYLEKTQNITFVDTTLTNMVAKVGDMITLPYYGSSTTNRITIYEQGSSVPCLTTDSDGKWVAGIPEGEYRMEVFYYDIYKDGVKGFTKDCSLIISGYNIIAGDYGLKCGTNNFLRINVFNNPDIQFNITWKISPDESNGAKLSISEKSTKSNQIQTNASSIYVHAGTETNNYTISGWMGNTEVVSSANISVHVFPYEIDAPDQIVRSYSIKSAPIGVVTLSEYSNHKWKLKKTYNGSGGNTELAKIGATTNSINKSSLNSSQVYFKSHKADEKYDLTATHELYTNVTDTVEFRTCDINFEPICTQVYDGKVVNPSGIPLNHFGYFYLEIEPFSFVNENISWSSKKQKIIFDMINTINNGRIIKVFSKFEGYDYIKAQIPDYYEIQPEMFVQCLKELKTIKLQPIVIKKSNGYYPGNVNSNVYYNQQYAQFTNSLAYLNLIYTQVGVNFEIESPIEYQSDISHNDLFYNVSLNNSESDYLVNDFKYIHPTFNGIKIFLVNEIEQKTNNINITRALTILNGDDTPVGIILPHNFKSKEFAHEIGHCCLLNDIYCDILKFDPLDYNSCLDLSVTSNYNYYNSFFTYYDAINSLLMCGKSISLESEPILEIPIRYIYGLKKIDTIEKGHIPTGLLTMERNPTTYGEDNESF